MDVPTEPPETALAGLIDRLHRRGRVRVWSLVITLFGDAIVPRGGEAPLAVLQAVMARLGIEAGALRTAMSRLASDGWVVRERRGRNSFFSLDRHGQHAFDLATRRIYAAGAPDWDGSWTVAIAAPGSNGVHEETLKEHGFLKIADGVYLLPRTPGPDDGPTSGAAPLNDMLIIHGSSAEHPEMLRSLWPSDEIAEAYRELIVEYSALAGSLAVSPLPAPVDAMAARTLLIHDWRRIVLRDPGLPMALLPKDWPGEEARTLVREVYRRLMEPSENWLDQAGLPPLVNADSFRHRFGR
ncbi:phenylacetic acid degradation operon negative regulatory protein [Nitratireductor aquibiodomus RA22]|uniref:Phenylacetic acid degradation operon negative regulatory protein n=1 Tax=Nitratireductor aquibiodomus RA22 TaxID=1189611 RepID=I5C4I8_9HYPH|nr:PaaX family transcriptional regulator C-terminal domain-containing protein [Nitratireductor aquibiodomus]EIM76740.1 phenylacetic acid degradation operon negative regulatory protein [Nitratireductor aquibiodomus RA22]